MSATLHVLCAGAVKGLVEALAPPFDRRIEARFGAVGAMRDALRGGAPCDALVVTEAMARQLEASGELAAGSLVAIGRVGTGVAVPTGASRPAIDDAAALKATFLAASALYFPDAERSTAGAHVAAVLDRLGIGAAMKPRWRMHPNGATAMRELAASADLQALGCTQITEIAYTPGIELIGALPGDLALSTVYGAGVSTLAADADAAARFIALLAGSETRPLRLAGGFEPEN